MYLSGNETIQGLTEEMKSRYTELKNSTVIIEIYMKINKYLSLCFFNIINILNK